MNFLGPGEDGAGEVGKTKLASRSNLRKFQDLSGTKLLPIRSTGQPGLAN